MENNLCISCRERPIFIKKWSLCRFCYQSQYSKGQIPSKANDIILLEISNDPRTIKKHEHLGELEFIKNFFTHNSWIPQPAQFNLDGIKYTPDFYDAERDVFVEVSRTKQAYSHNRHKYEMLRKLFPNLSFEIRRPSGELLDENESINSQLKKD